MPVTRGAKGKASQLSAQGQRNIDEGVTSCVAPASKAPRSKPSRLAKRRETRISSQENADIPVTPVMNAEDVEPGEPLTNVDDVATLQGMTSRALIENADAFSNSST